MTHDPGPGPAPAVNHAPPYFLLVKALAITAVLAGVKWFAYSQGLEFVQTLALVTGLMSGVVFTLAILLSGVLTDFKESERLVGELATVIRRLHWDLALIGRQDRTGPMRAQLLAATQALNASLSTGVAVRQRQIRAPLEELDRSIQAAASEAGATSAIRTVQVHMATLVRGIDRLEVIIETTFMRAGYWFAAAVVAAAIAGLTLTQIRPIGQALFLYSFATFLLTGLSLLIWELDNPFHGSVRISTRPLEKVEAYLTAARTAEAAPVAADLARGQVPR